MQHILISFLFVCHHHHHTHSLIIRRLRQIGLKYKDFSDIVRTGLEVGDTAIQRFDACISKSGPSVLLSPAAEPIRHAQQAIRKSGARMRLITDITTDNMFQCKELMKSFHEVRHLDYVKGHFLVTDSAYDATAAVGENAMALWLLHTLCLVTCKYLLNNNNAYLITYGKRQFQQNRE